MKSFSNRKRIETLRNLHIEAATALALILEQGKSTEYERAYYNATTKIAGHHEEAEIDWEDRQRETADDREPRKQRHNEPDSY